MIYIQPIGLSGVILGLGLGLGLLTSCQTFPTLAITDQVQIQRDESSHGALAQTRFLIRQAEASFTLEVNKDDDGSRAFLIKHKQRLAINIPEAQSIQATALCQSAKQIRLLLQVHYGGMNNYYEYYSLQSSNAKLDYVGGYEIFNALEAHDLPGWLNCQANQQTWQLQQGFVPCRCLEGSES